MNREEILAIGGEFGLSEADLLRASEAIAASRQETDREAKAKRTAMEGFKIHTEP